MIGLSKVLVVDQNKSSRETLCSVLSAHCQEVIEVDGIGRASELIESGAGLSLVLCENALSDGDPSDLLMAIGTVHGAKPALVVIATRPNQEEARRFQELGAIAYLARPISFIDLARVLKSSRQKLPEVAQRAHRRPLGTALVLDSQGRGDSRCEVSSNLLWDIHDVSVTGAFLESRGPLEPGHELSLGVVLDGQMLRVQACVIRSQEPSWEHVAGVGVAFLEFAPGAREEIQSFVARNA